jgi:2,3-bisphosphoglycerate-independent phosphoglycerate mutase
VPFGCSRVGSNDRSPARATSVWPVKSHSCHPVPLLLHSDRCSIDGSQEFSERAATRGELGTLLSFWLMGLLLANAGRPRQVRRVTRER